MLTIQQWWPLREENYPTTWRSWLTTLVWRSTNVKHTDHIYHFTMLLRPSHNATTTGLCPHTHFYMSQQAIVLVTHTMYVCNSFKVHGMQCSHRGAEAERAEGVKSKESDATFNIRRSRVSLSSRTSEWRLYWSTSNVRVQHRWSGG